MHHPLPTLEFPRVALFLDSARPSGSSVHALQLGEALHDRGVPVTVAALNDTGSGFFREPRCPHVLIPMDDALRGKHLDLRARCAAYDRYFEREARGFDVYHAQDAGAAAALAKVTARGSIPGFVRTVRHLEGFSDRECAALQDRSVTAAVQTFAMSRLMQKRLATTYGVDAAIVPNGVDLTRFQASTKERRAVLRSELGFAGGPLFVSIGNVAPRNNTLGILEAFAIVHATHPAATLAIAAGGSAADHLAYEGAFDARATELGLRIGHEIRILAMLPDSAIVTLLQAASALVSPSLIAGFGLAVLEALACETPVIASRIAPFTEYLAHDEALLVDQNDPFDIAEAMLNALEPAVAMVLAANGRESVRDRTWHGCASAHLAHYRSLLAARRDVARA